MGWKNVKEHYRIGHTVHVREGNICIGSPYISELIVVSPVGRFLKKYDGRGNDDLARYQREMEATPEKLRELINTPDHFEKHIPVYTFKADAIIEKFCENPDCPGPTHDGNIIYVNSFFQTREAAIAGARQNAADALARAEERVQERKQELAEAEERLLKAQRLMTKLNEEHPLNPSA